MRRPHPPAGPPSAARLARFRRRVEPVLRLFKAGLAGRILGHLVQVGFLDRTVILAAQAFSAILPLVIVVSTISPHPGGDSPAAFMARRLGLEPGEVSSLQGAVTPPASARASIGFTILRRLAAFYLPSLVASNLQQFGLLGVAFTLFSWVTASAFVIVVATVVGAVLAEDPGRLGRFIRGVR
jgi:hypothetical protein